MEAGTDDEDIGGIAISIYDVRNRPDLFEQAVQFIWGSYARAIADKEGDAD
ncbi:hypothetical protein PA598K_04609 [Paenibacillus sp. 598K]|nr:hypothetical protein PA598K_04609 [Paenibacillus sp. 598K]